MRMKSLTFLRLNYLTIPSRRYSLFYMKSINIPKTRDQILDAAETVVIERGVKDMTIEAVANRAGLSKGGLLYHFPTKTEIVQGMVSRIAMIIEQRFNNVLATEPVGQGRHAKTLLKLMLDPEDSLFPRLQSIAGPLLSAMAVNAIMLDPIRLFFLKIQKEMVADGLAVDKSWLILSALDGLKFWQIFQLLQPTPTELAQLRLLLLKIIDESS